jgi:hypothetical protein
MARRLTPAGRIPVVWVALFTGLAVGVAGAAQQSVLRVGPKEPVIPRAAFKVAASRLAPLRPGMSQALDLRLTNPHRYGLVITRLTVGLVVDREHSRAGCDRRRDFRSIRMPRRSYPIVLRPRRTVSLRRLGVRTLPRIAMLARSHNQDACKGARLTLKFGGRARRQSVGRPR